MARRFALALMLPLAIASAALAAPPTDDQIDTFIKNIEQAKTPEGADVAAKRAARRDAAKDGMKDLAIAEATLPQLQKLITKRAATASNDVAEAVDARLVVLAKDTGADGAKAAELRLQVIPAPEKPGPDAAKARTARTADLASEALLHPGAAARIKAGDGDALLTAISGLPSSELRRLHLFEALTPYVTTDLSPAMVSTFSRLTHPLVESRAELGEEKVEAFRSRLSAAAAAAIPRATKERDEQIARFAELAAPDPEDKDAVAKYKIAQNAKSAAESLPTRMESIRTLVDGPWARGTLIDHEAPAIAFEWSSGETPLKSFADLKGRVVMVDFWATWCGPCVAAFPKMRELQARYAGYPVTILGVTSNQGANAMERKRNDEGKLVAKKVDCSGNPEKEHSLAKEFMKDLEMTWTVAFSKQSCFNPDFGVRGIPSVAIIDSKGVVRFAGLYPNAKEEADHIDALLKEAKLPYPEAPYVEPPKEEKKDEIKKDDAKKDDAAKPAEPKKDAGKKD